MKADEARRLAINSVEDQIKDVKDTIQKAAVRGEVCISIHELKPATKAWLIENGYKVAHHDATNYGIDTISW